MGFSREEYWSGLPFPSPGDLPNPAIKPGSPTVEADALTSKPSGTKEDLGVGCDYGRLLGKAQQTRINLLCRFKLMPSPLIRVSRDLDHPLLLADFPGGSDGKASAHNVGDPGLIPGSGRSPGRGNGNPLQYSCLENSKDRDAW